MAFIIGPILVRFWYTTARLLWFSALWMTSFRITSTSHKRLDVSDQRLLDCPFNNLFEITAQLKFHNTVISEGIPSVTSGFPSQRASNAESVSIPWRNHGTPLCFPRMGSSASKSSKSGKSSTLKPVPRWVDVEWDSNTDSMGNTTTTIAGEIPRAESLTRSGVNPLAASDVTSKDTGQGRNNTGMGVGENLTHRFNTWKRCCDQDNSAGVLFRSNHHTMTSWHIGKLSALLTFCVGFHQSPPIDSPHKGPVMRSVYVSLLLSWKRPIKSDRTRQTLNIFPFHINLWGLYMYWRFSHKNEMSISRPFYTKFC